MVPRRAFRSGVKQGMRTVGFIAALALNVTVGAQSAPEPDVYAVLREERYHAFPASGMRVLDRSILMPSLQGASSNWLRQFASVPAELRELAMNQSPTKAQPFGPAVFPAEARMVSQEEIDALHAAHGSRFWDEFKSRFDATGWISFSDVILSREGLDALVYYEAQCGGLCAEAGYAWVHRDTRQSRWSVRLRVVRRMS